MNGFPKKILLATDGSENTAQATKAAVDIARRRGSEIHLIHVWHDVHTPHAHAFVKSELRRQGREILDEEVRRIGEKGGTVTRSHLSEGRTFEEVIKLGDKLEADLLLVGSRGHRGLRRMLVAATPRTSFTMRTARSLWCGAGKTFGRPPGSLQATTFPKTPGKRRSLPRTWVSSSVPGCSCCMLSRDYRKHPGRRSKRSWKTGRVTWKTSFNSGHELDFSQATLRRFS
jgi:nucleotide-binding universal stress UspA family protein